MTYFDISRGGKLSSPLSFVTCPPVSQRILRMLDPTRTRAPVCKRWAGLKGSRMPGIALVLLHAIGEGDSTSIVPKYVQYSAKHERYKAKQRWNVSKIMRNALSSALEILSFSKRLDGFTEEDFAHLQKLIRINQTHMIVLFEMRSQLIDCSNLVANSKQRVFGGIKLHILGHWVDHMIRFGADSEIFDTQLSEHFHINVKGRPAS